MAALQKTDSVPAAPTRTAAAPAASTPAGAGVSAAGFPSHNHEAGERAPRVQPAAFRASDGHISVSDRTARIETELTILACIFVNGHGSPHNVQWMYCTAFALLVKAAGCISKWGENFEEKGDFCGEASPHHKNHSKKRHMQDSRNRGEWWIRIFL